MNITGSLKCSIFLAVSVDNYIARGDDDITWLFEPEYALDDKSEDYGFKEFLASVDVLVMGRRSYEKVLTLGEWAYGDTNVRVLTHRELVVPEALQSKVTAIAGSPTEIVAQLRAEGCTHAYIDGGATIQQFLRERLIHEMTLTSIPVLLGSGISLFDANAVEQRLSLRSSTSYANGFVKSVYDVR